MRGCCCGLEFRDEKELWRGGVASSEKGTGTGRIEEDLWLGAWSDMGPVGSRPTIGLRLKVTGDPIRGSWRNGDNGGLASSCHLALSSSIRCDNVNSASSFCLARSCLAMRKSFSVFASFRVRFSISCFDVSRFLSIS